MKLLLLYLALCCALAIGLRRRDTKSTVALLMGLALLVSLGYLFLGQI